MKMRKVRSFSFLFPSLVLSKLVLLNSDSTVCLDRAPPPPSAPFSPGDSMPVYANWRLKVMEHNCPEPLPFPPTGGCWSPLVDYLPETTAPGVCLHRLHAVIFKYSAFGCLYPSDLQNRQTLEHVHCSSLSAPPPN